MATLPDNARTAEKPSSPEDTAATGSLAFRRNRDQILRGDVPEKYTRILPHVPGRRVLELGAAEGVLSLLLARSKEKVYALEMKEKRHMEALQLQKAWGEMDGQVNNCEMILGNIVDRFDLLEQVDTLVAVRSIYYLRERIHDVFNRVGQHVENVVLCGNRNRARKYAAGEIEPDDKLGAFNYFATEEGMRSILEENGYAIIDVVSEGDPIVVARKQEK